MIEGIIHLKIIVSLFNLQSNKNISSDELVIKVCTISLITQCYLNTWSELINFLSNVSS